MSRPAIPNAGTAELFRTRVLLLAASILMLFAAAPAAVEAASPEPFWTRCAADSEEDLQCSFTSGVATAPASAGPGLAGNVFVADSFNRRVAEFTVWGQFVRAWGWGVVASGPDDKPRNEIQQVSIDATAGSFRLNAAFGQTTTPISFDASAATVQAALEGMPEQEMGTGYIASAPGDFAVSGPTGGPWAFEFTGANADLDIRQLQVTNSTLSGGTGATVLTTQVGANFEICVPPEGDTCQSGQEGTSAGEFSGPQGVAVDSAGNVYVLDRGIPSNQRVQKFDPEGHFLLTFGKGVNQTSGGNLCPRPGFLADVCGAGGEGSGPGEFGELSVIGSYIAVDTAATVSPTDDMIYVGDQGRIQRFDTSGEFEAEIALPGETVRALAVDPAGNLHAAYCGSSGCALGAKANVHKFSPAGAELATVAVAAPEALATGPAVQLFVVDGDIDPTIRQFTSAGAEVLDFAFNISDFAPGEAVTESIGIATGSACLTAPSYDLYLGVRVKDFYQKPKGLLPAYGPPPDEAHTALCPPPLHAPEILDQGALAVEPDAATLQATINPRFWPDTSYYLQYGTAECIESGGWEAACVTQTPDPEALLGAGAIDAGAMTAKIELEGLTPNTEYTYRFAADSSGGGPVFGRGGTEAQEGDASTFTTVSPLPPSPETDCPNQALRVGPSAFLPDCRAYEMVSPVDKNGGDIRSHLGGGEYYVQASPDAERLTYTAEPAFGDQPSSKVYNQYLATREAGAGWSNRGINAPLSRQLNELLSGREGGPFSPDLCSEWVWDSNTTPLAPEAQLGYSNLYRQDLCGTGGFEALTTSTPAPGASPLAYVSVDSVQGFSADLGAVFFTARAGLTPEAASTAKAQLYVHTDAGLRLVSVLPGGVADPGGSFDFGAVLGSGSTGHRQGHLEHAVSSDGSGVFWSSQISSIDNTGKLYLRVHPEQGIVAAECSDPSTACTVEVSSGEAATFWSADPSGSEALYSEGKLETGQATLYGFDVESQTRSALAPALMGVLGASEDLSRIYYVSSEALSGVQENSEGQVAEAGQPNLYLDEGGERTFIATLAGGEDGDFVGPRDQIVPYHLGAPNPLNNAARVSADGAQLLFESRARLTGYNNSALNNGEAATEVFAYEAGGGLLCISCNPAGTLPAAKELRAPFSNPDEKLNAKTGVWGAAWIPTVEHPLYASNVLSEDGGRIFFNSFDPLLRRDTNGAQDVYEWEAPGTGSCAKESPSFHSPNGGCLYLISSGESSSESTFIAAGPDGRDVFFTTEAGLLPEDPGSFDIYDARAGGGFPRPTEAAVCEGEACQSPPSLPNDPTPASSAFEGAGNVVEPAAKPCAKGKVKKHGRCVKKHRKAKRKHHQRRADHNRGATR